MRGPFKPGDVCYLQNANKYPELNGMEVTIASDLELVHNERIGFWHGYDVGVMHKGLKLMPRVHQLRLKRRPQDDLSAWAADKVNDLVNSVTVTA